MPKSHCKSDEDFEIEVTGMPDFIPYTKTGTDIKFNVPHSVETDRSGKYKIEVTASMTGNSAASGS